MRSDSEFYLGEYVKCCAKCYGLKPLTGRIKEFYERMKAAMWTAYIEAGKGATTC